MPEQSPSSSRRRDIQGLRAVAVIVVVAFHSRLGVPGGFIGVDMFFVISGFVITGMLQREWASAGRIEFPSFYWRRFKRLTPALALAVTVTLVSSISILSVTGPQQNAAKTGIGAMLLVANFVIARSTGGYFDAPAETNPLLNTWSLSVEEQFYLVFPALIASMWIWSRKRQWLQGVPIVAVTLVAGVSFALACLGSSGIHVSGSASLLGFYSPLTRAWEFAIGALLALSATTWRRLRNGQRELLGWAGLLLLLGSLTLINSATPFPGPVTLLPVIATGFLLAAGTGGNPWTSRVLAMRPFVVVGDLSYSIYLWHWPLIVFAALLWPATRYAVPLAALVSIAPAALSYVWVEQPIRKRAYSGRRPRTLLLTAVLAPPVLAGVLVFYGAQHSWLSAPVAQWVEATTTWHAGHERACDTRVPMGVRGPAECTWNASASGAPIYLLGDSNADHFSEAFISVSNRQNRPLQIATTNACPFIDVFFVDTDPTENNSQCREYVQRSLEFLDTAEPGLVVVSNSENSWTSSASLVGQNAGTLSNDPLIKAPILRGALAQMVRRLEAAGHQVLLVQSAPTWQTWDPSRCPTIWIALHQGCKAVQPITRVLQAHRQSREAIESIQTVSSSLIWDPVADLCPGGECSTEASEGFTRYRDWGHISVPQAEALADSVSRVLAPTP